MIRISNRNTGFLQVAHSTSDISRGHIVPWVAVVSNYQDPCMTAVRGGRDQVVQTFEVPVVPREYCPPVTDRMGKVHLVGASGQSDVSGKLNIMSVAAQQAD